MKKLFLLAGIAGMALSVTAQLKVDLSLNATPPATLSEWGNRREVLTCIVTTQPGGAAADVKIKAEIKTLDGTVIGTTDLASAPVYNIATSAVIFTANDVIPLDKMIFNGKYKSSLQRSGKLPSDNYMLCVQLVRPIDYTPASNQVCKNFYLATTQLPILMKPYNEEILDPKIAQTAITFRWTPLVPRPTLPVTYHIQVFEVLEHQTPMQALRSNQPLLDQEVKGTTQYIWRPQLVFFNENSNIEGKETKSAQKNINTSEAGLGAGKDKKNAQKNINTSEDNLGSGHNKTFIWTVQTLDDHGLPVTQTDGNGEARSEPIVFHVGTNKMKAKEKANRSK